ncbi:hypothetical protein BGX28_002037 [Mortierella sp. GBA30]|nr:hypothetical protein BGX28_002037 [Mortierella sp. GBA30]
MGQQQDHNPDGEITIDSGASELRTEDMDTDTGDSRLESDSEQSHSESELVDRDTDESGSVLTTSQLRKKDLSLIKLRLRTRRLPSN